MFRGLIPACLDIGHWSRWEIKLAALPPYLRLRQHLLQGSDPLCCQEVSRPFLSLMHGKSQDPGGRQLTSPAATLTQVQCSPS